MATKKRTNKKDVPFQKRTEKKAVPTVREHANFLSWFKESAADKKASK